MSNSAASSPTKKHRQGGFRPLNTLTSTDLPKFPLATLDINMANEREPPPAPSLSAASDQEDTPQFGKPSPVRNPLKPRTSGGNSMSNGGNIFNIPKRGKQRGEHHRDRVASSEDPFKPVIPSSLMGTPNLQRPLSPSKQASQPLQPQPSRPPQMQQQPQPLPAQQGQRPPQQQQIPQQQRPQPQQQRPQQPPSFRLPQISQQQPSAPPPSTFRPPSYTQPHAFAAPLPTAAPRPTQHGFHTSSQSTRPMFSSAGNFRPVNAFKEPVPASAIDLTTDKDDNDGFDVSKALSDDRFGDFDPNSYVDSEKANENIKALLEGAFDEDNEDKPKSRRRKKKSKDAEEQENSADALAKGLQDLKVQDGTDQKPFKNEAPDDADDEEDDDGAVDGLNVKLLPHQIDGLAWMLDKETGKRKKNGVLPNGGILADDMGLGKTIQALALILSNPRPDKESAAEVKKRKIPEEAGKGTLVVAPLALIKQWEAEIKDKTSSERALKVLVHHGPSRTKSSEALKKYDIVITTYQTLTSEHDGTLEPTSGGVFGNHWYRVILDEAHSIKNRSAKMTKASYALRSVYRWCLTGTPMQNNLDELQSLICFLQIKPYCRIAAWRQQIGQPMKNGKGGLAIKRLQYFLKAFMKRRTKEVLKKEGGLNFGKPGAQDSDKPQEGFKIVARNVQTIVAEFDEAEQAFYDKLAARTSRSLDRMMRSSKNDYIGALVLLLRLRQLCNHPKLLKGNLKKEKDSMAAIPPTPRKQNNSDDLDDVAAMFNTLSVKAKKCDICQVELSSKEVLADMIRCRECEDDVQTEEAAEKKRLRQERKNVKKSVQNTKRFMHSRRVVDSDDEDAEGAGEWLVDENGQKTRRRSKAGGKDDEDAEGGGEWLNSEESGSDNDDEDESKDRNSGINGGSAIKYDTSEDEDEDEDSTFTRAVASTKIKRLLEILERESSEHKFIVFSEFTSMLDIIEPFLQDQGYRFVRYDGSMRNDEREASLQSLRTNPATRILLCSLKCGSLGLNLTAASRVVILEPFWNPFVEEQAIDRVHRLNQTQDVTVYKLTIANSVEDKIIALQERKRELARAAIEGGKSMAKLDMKDILRLFGHDAEDDRHQLGDGPSSSGSGDDRALGGIMASTSLSQFDSAYGRRW